MDYYKISIIANPAQQDIIIALLSELGYDGFEQNDFGLKTYRLVNEFEEATLKEIANQLGFNYKKKVIPDQNWNAVWESRFSPLQIRNFCAIRADFHPHFPNVKYEITVNPKMAFGTGHHETTYMMIEQMERISFENTKVLDFGCGTGILSILAEKLGATHILALDNDPNCYENSDENAKANKTSKIQIQLGDIYDVNDDEYDIVLANINRNVIFNTLPILYQKINKGGTSLFSGILRSDETVLIEKIEQTGYSIIDKQYKGGWVCLKVQKG